MTTDTDTEALQQMATQKLAGVVQAAIYDLSDGRRFPDLMAAVVELERRAEHAAAKADAAHVGTPEAWINWNAATETTLRAAQPAPQPAAQQGKPSEYPPELKTEGEHKAYCFGWWKALEVHRRSNTTDATRHKIINDGEAALDAAGAPAGTLVERIGALGEDAARLDWLTFNISGKALRDIGVIWSEHGDARRAIDAARTQTEIDMIGAQSTGAGANHA